MAVPRPIAVLAALAVVLLAATFYTVRSAREQTQTEQISKLAQTAQPKPVTPPAGPKAKAKAKAHTHKAAPAAPAHKAPAKPHRQPKQVVKPGPVKKKDPGASLGLPGAVARAIGSHKTVVVLFYHHGQADDDDTLRSVRSVRSKRVAVFTASPRQFGNYKQLVGGLALSSLPATVIVGRDRAARVLEGFVDPSTMAQEVADSSR